MKQFGQLLFLLPFIVFARELHHGEVMVSVADTSDHLILRTLNVNFRNNRREINYPFPEESDKAWDFGVFAELANGSAGTVKFKQSKLNLLLGKKINKRLLIESSLGLGELENESNGNNVSFTPLSLAVKHQGEWLYKSLSYLKDTAISDMNFPTAVESFLKKDVIDLDLLLTVSKIRLRLIQRYFMLSDNNKRYYSDLDFKFNLSVGDMWLLAGIGAEYYSNRKDVAGYWTPRRFVSYGPRFEATIPFNDYLIASVGGNFNRFIDEQSNSGTGYYLNSCLQYRKREQSNLKVCYERVESQQNSSKWYYDRPYLAVTHFW